jgi:hypothetical protein
MQTPRLKEFVTGLTSNRYTGYLLQGMLFLWLAAGINLQHDLGLADNGDYARSMGMFSVGPVGMEEKRPIEGTERWGLRFADRWVPAWRLNWEWTRPNTSALLLWLPGAGVNYLFVSDTVLYLPIISLLPKLLLAVLLWLIFRWIDHHAAGRRKFLYLSLGAPVVLFMTTTDYFAYMNSFYQEQASFIYVLGSLASLVYLQKKPDSTLRFLLSVALFTLLATAKASNIYWTIIGIGSAGFIWRGRTKTLRIGVTVCVVTLTTFFAREITRPGTVRVNAYHSLFYGILTFSNDTSSHLDYLGIPQDAASCVGTHAYSGTCYFEYRSHLKPWNAPRVLLREPLAVVRMMNHAAQQMQDISIDYLAKRAADHPEYTRPVDYLVAAEHRYHHGNSRTILNAWSTFKFALFPTGGWFWGAALFAGVCYLWGLRQRGWAREISIVGLVAMIGCLVDMFVALLGDGRYELIKHLFLANVLFDVGAIALLTLGLTYGLKHTHR